MNNEEENKKLVREIQEKFVDFCEPFKKRAEPELFCLSILTSAIAIYLSYGHESDLRCDLNKIIEVIKERLKTIKEKNHDSTSST